MTDESSHLALIALLKKYSLRIGEFTLASGRKSHYYIDARPTTMSAEGLEVIGKYGVRLIAESQWRATLVGGVTLGADPVAYGIAAASRNLPPTIDAFTVRKEAKTYGTGRRIEGCFSAGATVVVVEDVITSGGSALSAIRAVEEAEGRIAGVLAVVDRMEGGKDAIQAAGYDVRAMVTIQDLGVDPVSPTGE